MPGLESIEPPGTSECLYTKLFLDLNLGAMQNCAKWLSAKKATA